MPNLWKEVVRLSFKGRRFQDHALDLSALSELSQFQRLVAETAKALWRAANPDRERLPRHFEERTRLCLRKIEEGSAVAPLEVLVEEPEQTELWEPEPKEVEEAIELAHQVFGAVERDESLPEQFPKQLVAEYVKWGQSLAEDEEVELTPPGRGTARISSDTRKRLAMFSDTPYEDVAKATGEVLEADVRQRRFQLWLDARTAVAVRFSEEQEELVTTALRDHRSVRLRVSGKGKFTPAGQLQQFDQVESLEIKEKTPQQYDPDAPAIEDVLLSLASEVPAEEWSQLPNDLTDDLDHYLYGTPKR
ncbi:MAG: hypothetical protein ABIF82_04620 [Planctomycetota bacterium]